MKKLAALFLAVVMTFALSMTAAADTTPLLWEKLGYGSLNELLEWEGVTAEEYEVIAAASESFDPYAYFEEHYYFYDSADEYMEIMVITEEEFASEMLKEWFYVELERIMYEKEREEKITAAGGMPGELNVMVNGACVPFTGVSVTAKDGRTMVPMRTVLQYIGFTVSYDESGVVTAQRGDAAITHVIGTDVITLADETEVKMDVASYVEDGNTMVPLRFFAEAAGIEVYWDAEMYTAVLIDRTSLVSGIDASFTVLNELMKSGASQIDPEKGYKASIALDGLVTILNSIDGNIDVPISGSMDMHYNSETINLDASVDLSGIMAFAAPFMGEQAPEELIGNVSPLELSMIMSGDKVYAKSGILDWSLSNAYPGTQTPKNFWFEAALTESVSDIFGDIDGVYENMTVGSIIYDSMSEYADHSPFAFASDLSEAAAAAALVIGDDTFTKLDNGWSWDLGEDDLLELLSYTDGMTAEDIGPSELTANFTVRDDGSSDVSMVFAMSEGGFTSVRMELAGTSTATEATLEMSLQVLNTCDLTLSVECAADETAEEPAAEPPVGSLIIDENYSPMSGEEVTE